MNPCRPARPLDARERRVLRATARRIAAEDPALALLLAPPGPGDGRAALVDRACSAVRWLAAAALLAGFVLQLVVLVLGAIVLASLPLHSWMRQGPDPAGD